MNPCGSMDRPRFSVRSSPLRNALLSKELQEGNVTCKIFSSIVSYPASSSCIFVPVV